MIVNKLFTLFDWPLSLQSFMLESWKKTINKEKRTDCCFFILNLVVLTYTAKEISINFSNYSEFCTIQFHKAVTSIKLKVKKLILFKVKRMHKYVWQVADNICSFFFHNMCVFCSFPCSLTHFKSGGAV